ncbi:protein NPGR2-like isoform X2 [Humulus lupulus]|uniref:protein NPGR2-like isoform X2 n=1 Tax=Humulus lupulus TaxID=3486 RepID=UPI002B4029F1|nr:protein NPGR2-like isoform X2 [Humulus lupulus]
MDNISPSLFLNFFLGSPSMCVNLLYYFGYIYIYDQNFSFDPLSAEHFEVVQSGMRTKNFMNKRKFFGIPNRVRKMLKCMRSGEQVKMDEIDHSSDSLATRDYSASGYSSRLGEADPKVDNSNIEEAESSLRESGYLNYEEARALLGRLEYQKGNIEVALHVFEGIDIAAVTPRMKVSISRRCEQNRRRSQSDYIPPMSMHAVSLLLEAVLLKAKSLQGFGRYEEAAQTCKVILDTVEFALPDGLPENFTSDCKLQDTLSRAVESLLEFWSSAIRIFFQSGHFWSTACAIFSHTSLLHCNFLLVSNPPSPSSFSISVTAAAPLPATPKPLLSASVMLHLHSPTTNTTTNSPSSSFSPPM